MRSLLYKDWELIRSSRSYLFPSLFLLVVFIPGLKNSPVVSAVPVIFSYYFLVTLNAYDYKYNGSTFLLSFPVSRNSWVGAKYIIGAISMVLSFSALFLFGNINRYINPAPMGFIGWTTKLVFAYVICIIYLAIIQFGYFRLGYLKMKIMNIVALAIASGINGIILEIISDRRISLYVPIISLLPAVLIYYLSFCLSCRRVKTQIIL